MLKRELKYTDQLARSEAVVPEKLELINSVAVGHEEALPVKEDLVGAFLELVKIRITFFVGMSALFGYILAANDLYVGMIVPVLGIFLISCASAATNHYQERDTDALMHRTSRRPLPSGLISPGTVLSLIFGLTILGSALLLATGNTTALFFSLLAFVAYNAVYTPLKKVTPLAVIPGSFVGSLPVMAGWAAGGGEVLDPRLLAISSFFFIWQIPHFWLLMDMYSADYERAKFPTLRLYFDQKSFAVLTFMWMVVLAFSSVFFVTTGIVVRPVTEAVLAILGIFLIAGTYKIVPSAGDKRANKSAFMVINIYVLAVTLAVMLDRALNLVSIL